MGRPTATPPTRWIEEGLRALVDGGPDAVRIEALARSLGVTKGGFYNHFGDRPALLGEMLDSWERLVVDHVIERVDREGGDARAKLRRLFELGVAAPGKMIGIELAMRDWARHDKAVARRLKRLDNRRMGYLRAQFSELVGDEDEVELRCMLAMSLFIGVPSIAADYGPGRRGEVY